MKLGGGAQTISHPFPFPCFKPPMRFAYAANDPIGSPFVTARKHRLFFVVNRKGDCCRHHAYRTATGAAHSRWNSPCICGCDKPRWRAKMLCSRHRMAKISQTFPPHHRLRRAEWLKVFWRPDQQPVSRLSKSADDGGSGNGCSAKTGA